MNLDDIFQKLTAFIITDKGQFHLIILPMGLLRSPASFQRLTQGVLSDIRNITVYSDDLLIHTDSHDKHLDVLEEPLTWLHWHYLKINSEKCVFDNKKSPISGLHLHMKGSSQEKINLKLSKKQKTLPISKQSDHLWAFAISSWHTSNTLQLMLPSI